MSIVKEILLTYVSERIQSFEICKVTLYTLCKAKHIFLDNEIDKDVSDDMKYGNKNKSVIHDFNNITVELVA